MSTEPKTKSAAWKVYDGPHINPMFNGIVCMISASDRLIAVITEDETMVHPDTWSDIARLISAAPDMLAALKVARATIIDLKNARWSEAEGSDEDWVTDIDAALSKANPGAA